MANEPITPSTNDQAPSAPVSVFRTYAKDLAAFGGRAAQVIPPKQTNPASPKPVAPQAPVPPPEPPPARIIPKAPSTDESREAVLTRLREVSKQAPAEETPTPIPEPPAARIIPKAPSTDESKEAILARLKKNAASVNRIETPAPIPAQPPAAPVKPASAAPVPIHTYKTDFADHIDAKKASTFSVLAAQSDEGTVPATRIKERSRFPVAIVFGFVLILAGGGAVYYALNEVGREPAIPYVSNVPSLILADEHLKLEGEGVELMSALAASASLPLASEGVRVTYTARATTSPDGMPIDTPLPGGALLAALQLPAPEILLRNIEPASTVGIVQGATDARAFFILKVSSYERTFAGMLEWEPRILADLELLYPPYPSADMGTSTPAVTVLPAFEDEILANRDVRVLRDTLGRALILYGYRDKDTLIIARDEASFLTLIERLSTSRGQ